MEGNTNDGIMIYTSENKVLAYNGQILTFKINSLSFEVIGAHFPEWVQYNSQSVFLFSSTVPQKVQVNWGDGNVTTHEMKPFLGVYEIAWTQNDENNANVNLDTLQPTYIYQDANTGSRIITFSFEDITKLIGFNDAYIRIWGAFPIDIIHAVNLESLRLNTTGGITSFPENLTTLRKLKELQIARIGAGRVDQIPDSFFELPIESFITVATFNLADPISSNLFKLNQWKDTLVRLDLEGSLITEVDATFSELTNLTSLNLYNNRFTVFPPEILNLTNLTLLRIGFLSTVQNISFPDFSSLNQLETMLFEGQMILSEIPTKWVVLEKLKTIQSVQFMTQNTTVRNDSFISYFYQLVTENASITPSANNKFRNMAWGHSSFQFTGAKVAPTGYVQGVSNGDANTPGKRVYVMQNQFGHTITHGTPL